MKSEEFHVVLEQLKTLSSKQRRLLEKALTSPDPREKVRDILENKWTAARRISGAPTAGERTCSAGASEAGSSGITAEPAGKRRTS